MNKIKTIIFDFDGTLADCKELHQGAFRGAVETICPGAEYTDEEVEGRPTREKIRILNAKGYSFNGDKLNELKQLETQRNLERYIVFNVELFDTILGLTERGYQLAVCSNATELFVNRSLEILQIKQFFYKINTASDFPAKPDTTTFFNAIGAGHSKPDNTLIVEDSEVGIQCAKATGCSVLEVTNQSDTIKQINEIFLK